ncbi:1D-myo-inositol 2-acetamido-2-deoxy-alpha-D-glucopyranoside deacetylase [Polystyrenella longa]|uniref:1D-myo-inositol 2-acetamido-2-deoxy-alpha-D-glucopyranoside deacetylase n=1 Tax=Polystyrenella longa TaxID=2528007 RepID=A0A518CIJ2_9PLAN|nr:bacillithiol biosynthesis deacetylase BshB1 [Polystyrenella longa]QDU79017.1 1D-myo-inositol 2-acetamido-2-deoxy-alpha-D-glucopyranoside deacetylase [Polystyrenella longa]
MADPISPPELDLLVVSPHPDDAEISVGGTILKSKQAGLKVGVLELTNGEPTPHGSPEIRAKETAAATQVLGLDWRGNLRLPNRSLQNTLEARAALAGVFRLSRPKVILAPYWEDVHPDHVAASQLVDDARFWAKLSKTDMPGERYWPPTMYYYWSIHLRNHPKPSFVLDISNTLEQKIDAIRCYESQMLVGRPTEFPTVLDDIRDRNRYWGWAIHTAYGEPFASREEIGLPLLPTLSTD